MFSVDRVLVQWMRMRSGHGLRVNSCAGSDPGTDVSFSSPTLFVCIGCSVVTLFVALSASAWFVFPALSLVSLHSTTCTVVVCNIEIDISFPMLN